MNTHSIRLDPSHASDPIYLESHLFPLTFETAQTKLQKKLFSKPPAFLKPSFRKAVVLVSVCFAGKKIGTVLVKKQADLLEHGDQWAFPGGKMQNGESVSQTAFREWEEEVGWSCKEKKEVGFLPLYHTLSSAFEVVAQVVLLKDTHLLPLDKKTSEIEQSVFFPFTVFLKKEVFSWEILQKGGYAFKNPVFSIESKRIWGLTARVLHELLLALVPEERIHA